jgi:hypothetical protein
VLGMSRYSELSCPTLAVRAEIRGTGSELVQSQPILGLFSGQL